MNGRIFIIIFTVLGIIIGVISTYVKSQLAIFSFLIASYLIVFTPIYMKHKTEKEVKKLITETAFSYLLMWVVIFFLVSNL